jgi:hypothetical protein
VFHPVVYISQVPYIILRRLCNMPICIRGDHKADRALLGRGSRDFPAKTNIEGVMQAHEADSASTFKRY